MADKDKKAGKKLPDRASRSHPKHAKRMGHKARAAIRHAANRAANDAREAMNAEARAAGLPTPWQASQAARRERRANTQGSSRAS